MCLFSFYLVIASTFYVVYFNRFYRVPLPFVDCIVTRRRLSFPAPSVTPDSLLCLTQSIPCAIFPACPWRTAVQHLFLLFF